MKYNFEILLYTENISDNNTLKGITTLNECLTCF